jgi:hypothetical protein
MGLHSPLNVITSFDPEVKRYRLMDTLAWALCVTCQALQICECLSELVTFLTHISKAKLCYYGNESDPRAPAAILIGIVEAHSGQKGIHARTHLQSFT